MYKYLLIDNEGYCYGFSILNSIKERDYMILIDSEEDENEYMYRKYDKENNIWLNEYKNREIDIVDQLSQKELEERIMLEYLVAMQELNTIF